MADSSLSDVEENLMFALFSWQPFCLNFHIVPDLKAKKKETGFVSGREKGILRTIGTEHSWLQFIVCFVVVSSWVLSQP